MFWDELLKGQISVESQAKIKAIAEHEMATIQDHPRFDEAVMRLGRRKAELFAAEQFGIAPTRIYPTVYDFFDDYLRPAYQVQDTNQTNAWCGHWWDHRSVLHRVTAMWRAYEYLALTDPARADEVFLRSMGDHHMQFLLGERSPMVNCRSQHSASLNLDSDPREDTTNV